jgi:hypothetical protein
MTELDPRERAALEALLAPPELTATEWERLHGRILRAAEPRLAALRQAEARATSGDRGFRRRLRWLAPTVPLAAAALLLLFAPGRRAGSLGEAEAALLADVPDHEFSRIVAGHADAAALLLLAVQGDDGDGG